MALFVFFALAAANPRVPSRRARSDMDVFKLRKRLVSDYRSYTRSFIKNPLFPNPGVRRRHPRSGGVLAGAATPAQSDVQPRRHDRRSGGAGDSPPGMLASLPSRQVRKRPPRPPAPPASAPARGDPRGETRPLLRIDDRHWLGKEPCLHCADRRPRTPARVRPRHSSHRRLSHERAGQQPERGARQVHPSGLSRRPGPSFVLPGTPGRRKGRLARRFGAIHRTYCSRTT